MERARGEAWTMRVLVVLVAFGFAMCGCATPPAASGEPALARFFLESSNRAGREMILPQSETAITVDVKPVVSEFDIVRVDIAEVELGKCLQFQLTPAASRDLYRLSVANQGQRLVLMVKGRAMGARRIDGPLGPLADGVLMVFVETPDDQLPALQKGLNETSAELQRVARKL